MDEKAKKADEALRRGPLFTSSPAAGPSTVRQSTFADYSNINNLTTDPSSSPTKGPDRGTTSSHALQPMDPNSWLSRSASSSRDRTLKPFGSSTFGSASNRGKATIMDISDDDDDVIEELVDDRIPPGMRKSNKAPPIVVRDRDQDVKPMFGSSQRSSSQSSASRGMFSGPSRFQSFTSSQPKGTCFFPSFTSLTKPGEPKASKKASALPKREVQERYHKELTHLKIAHKAFGAG